MTYSEVYVDHNEGFTVCKIAGYIIIAIPQHVSFNMSKILVWHLKDDAEYITI